MPGQNKDIEGLFYGVLKDVFKAKGKSCPAQIAVLVVNQKTAA